MIKKPLEICTFLNPRYDRRLLFKDLNENSILNGVNTGELLTLWTPELQFLNALGPFQTIVDDLNVCTILYEEQPTYDDITESVECRKYHFSAGILGNIKYLDYKFDAAHNSINLLREYYQEFSCEFDLLFYPFDTQVTS